MEDLVVPEDLAAAFDRHPGSREQWDAFPRSIRRAILEWIVNAKKAEMRARWVEESARLAERGERANQMTPPNAPGQRSANVPVQLPNIPRRRPRRRRTRAAAACWAWQVSWVLRAGWAASGTTPPGVAAQPGPHSPWSVSAQCCLSVRQLACWPRAKEPAAEEASDGIDGRWGLLGLLGLLGLFGYRNDKNDRGGRV